jgi:hypothetical protein
MTEPSRVTKVLVKKIHSGRKQDSKFWQSEFPRDKTVITEPTEQKSEKTLLYSLIILTLIIVAYVSYNIYSRYYVPSETSDKKTSESDSSPTYKQQTKYLEKSQDKPTNKKESFSQNKISKDPVNIKYKYIVILKNGRFIDADSISSIRGILHLKTNKGLSLKIANSEVETIKKIRI